MRIGIITDIHSNIEALNAVLEEFDKAKVDKIICCGDIIGIGPNPEETVQILIENKEKLIIVSGNHEKYLIEGLPKEVHNKKRDMTLEEIQNHKWNHSKLSEKSKKFISKLPMYEYIKIENKIIYITHYPINNAKKYKVHIKNPSIKEIEELFNNINADIFLYGHTHTINVKKSKNKWYINPGALGCPKKSNIANAGILEINNDRINFKQLAITYNVNNVINKIKTLQFPFYKEILKIFYDN